MNLIQKAYQLGSIRNATTYFVSNQFIFILNREGCGGILLPLSLDWVYFESLEDAVITVGIPIAEWEKCDCTSLLAKAD